jgi:hypothetical protein
VARYALSVATALHLAPSTPTATDGSRLSHDVWLYDSGKVFTGPNFGDSGAMFAWVARDASGLAHIRVAWRETTYDLAYVPSPDRVTAWSPAGTSIGSTVSGPFPDGGGHLWECSHDLSVPVPETVNAVSLAEWHDPDGSSLGEPVPHLSVESVLGDSGLEPAPDVLVAVEYIVRIDQGEVQGKPTRQYALVFHYRTPPGTDPAAPTVHTAARPLRQRQRDDGLISGVWRAHPSSVQASIRQRSYY